MSVYSDGFMEAFEAQIEALGDKLEAAVKLKVLNSANKIAAYTEMQIRSPDLAERLDVAKLMEVGIIQTALAKYELDCRQALKDSVYRGLFVLAQVAL